MKTYLRILSYGKPIQRLLPFYCISIILAITFGLINFSLLIPLLEILFSQTDTSQILEELYKPTFHFGLAYFKDLFRYYFMSVIITEGKIKALYFVCVVIIASVLITNIFRYLAEIIVAEVRTRIIHNLRGKLFTHLSRLHIGYFTHKKSGDVIAKFTSDIQEIEHAIIDVLRVFFKEPATIVGFFLVMYHISSKFTLFSLVFLPLAGMIVAKIVDNLRKSASQSQVSMANLIQILQEMLGGMRIIKAFEARTYMLKKFGEENEQYAHTSLSMELKKSLAPPLSEFLGVGIIALILAYGGKQVLTQETDLAASTFITYIIIFSQALIPIKSISKSLSNIQRGLAAGKRVFELMDSPPAIGNKKNAIPIANFQQAIVFKQVSFWYDKKPILQDINLTIKKGKTIALVGPSGGGKSTIADLLIRLYEVSEGDITIDGISIREYELYALRQLMGVVSQESILLHDTVYNNIAFGRPGATQEMVMQAAQIAHAHDFIMELPEGYQTLVGERGSKLSGGQAQRLTIARAILTNPPILILDEATSALDSASEELVQKALNQFMRHRTALVIAHRLSTIKDADEIIVLEEGRIVERGTHDELMLKKGVYKTLNRLQGTA